MMDEENEAGAEELSQGVDQADREPVREVQKLHMKEWNFISKVERLMQAENDEANSRWQLKFT